MSESRRSACGARRRDGEDAMAQKRLPLPKRFSAALTEPAYDRLRQLNARYGLSNNYLLTILLERLDDFAEAERLEAVFRDFIDEYGAPAAGAPMRHARSTDEPGEKAPNRKDKKETP